MDSDPLVMETLGGVRPELEVGYGLLSEFSGKGLATELATAAVEAAFGRLGLDDSSALLYRPTRRLGGCSKRWDSSTPATSSTKVYLTFSSAVASGNG